MSKKVKSVNLNNYDKNILVPLFKVWIGGKELSFSRKNCITSVEIKETVTGSDSATLKISDPNFVFIDDTIFIEDKKIKIHMCWDKWSTKGYRVKFEGFITAVDINFASNGIPELSITCMDKTHRMNRKSKSRTFKNKTSAQIVKSILKNYGFKCKVDKKYKFAKQDNVSQSKQTDIAFIEKLASDETHPFTARLVGDTFIYEEMGKLKKPKLSLTYRKYPYSLVSFSPKINTQSRNITVSNSSVNSSSKGTSSSKGSVSSNNGGNKSKNNNSKNNNSNNNSSSNSSSNNGGKRKYNYTTRSWTKV